MNAVTSTEAQVVNTVTTLPQHTDLVVPFSALVLSPENVRKRAPSPERLTFLAGLIRAQGLLNALHVSAEVNDGKPTGRYAVEAGGRRWRALGMLVKAGDIGPDEPIRCKLVAAESRTETSLAENVATEGMSPADEFEAYLTMSRQGKSAEAIAASFGATVVHVVRRMKLASVAPEIYKLYRDERATLDQLMALACVDDHKRQIAAWKSLPEYNRSASALKRKLLEEEVPVSDDRVKLITLARYEASGGAVRRDLFSDEVFMSDAGLVDYIVAEVLTERADQVALEGYGWIEPLVEFNYEARQRFREPPARFRGETDDERARREALEAELEALEGRMQELYEADEGDEEARAELKKLEAASGRIDQELQVLKRSLIDLAAYAKASLGCVVCMENGKLKVVRNLMTAEAYKSAMRAAAAGASSTGGSGAAGPGGAVGVVTPPARAEYGEKLMGDLTCHRTAAIQAMLIEKSDVAVILLTVQMATQVLGKFSRSLPVKVSATTCRSTLEREASGFAECAAAKAIDGATRRWLDTLPQDPQRWFGFLLKQPYADVLCLLGFCASQCVDTVQRRAGSEPMVDAITAALDLDVSMWWHATEETYLSHVTKAQMAKAVTEAKGAEAAQPMLKMKAAEARVYAARHLVGTNWLPTPLRRSPA